MTVRNRDVAVERTWMYLQRVMNRHGVGRKSAEMIGVFGGTFDPVHFGHLEPAKDVYESLGLDRVLFIPNNVPPHRDQPVLGAAQRVELLQLALVDYPGFEIDLREMQRSGPSWMVDTLDSLKQDYPDQTLVLIIGMDAFSGLTSWHRWQDLFDYCHIVVTTRPGYELPEDTDPRLLQRLVDEPDRLAESAAGKILIKSTSMLDISSTGIRSMLESGDDTAGIMPDAVCARYREIMGLYAHR